MKKVLVVGYGSIGKRHVQNLLEKKSLEVIVVTKQKIISKNSRLKIIHNLDDALKEKPDIGFVTNETRFHLPTAIKLARNGINLFIEKPLSDSLNQVKTLQKIVKDKKLITMIGCNLRFFPPISKIKKLIEQNKIGKIISVQIENGSYLPDWHPYEDYRKGYAAKKKLGGGVSLTQIHEVDYLKWFFGNALEINSLSGKFSNLDIDVDDYSTSILKFKKNIICEIHLDFLQRPQYKRCKIRGLEGIIEWDSESNKVKIFNPKQKKWKNVHLDKNYNLTQKKRLNLMYKDELDHFMNCIKNKKNTINSLDDAIDTLKIALAIRDGTKLKKINY